MRNCVNDDGKCEIICDHESIVPKYGNTEDYETATAVKGIERLNNKKFNKGLAFTIRERQLLGIHGLLPPVVKTEEQQVEHLSLCVNRWKDKLDKLNYLMGTAARHQRLFFQLIRSDLEKFLPLIYTPTVYRACQTFGVNYINPNGLFITIMNRGYVREILRQYPESQVRLIVVTDGEYIKDYGDLGSQSMAMAIGHSLLYTCIGGIKPDHCLPITLDCGTNNKNLLLDPLYIGLSRQRLNCGCKYDQFLDELMDAIVQRYGPTCIIQFENFSNDNAFRLLERYGKKFCTFNYDIQGVPAIVLAGIYTALRITKNYFSSQTILIYDANEVSIGIARLIMHAQMRDCDIESLAKHRIWLFDEKGLVVRNRPSGGLTQAKYQFAQYSEPIDSLIEAIEFLRPNILIGAASKAGAFTPEVIKLMAKINERPIIFVLSNCPSMAECTARDAMQYTFGKCIFASGVHFLPVEINFRTYFSNYIHHVPIPYGIALGILCAGMRKIPTEVFLIGVENFVEFVTVKELSKGIIYPNFTHTRARCVVIEIARWIMEYAYKYGLASVFPEPTNKVEFIKSQLYDPSYQAVIPELYLKDEKW